MLARIATAFDPRGRARRTDLLGFAILLGFAGLFAGGASILLGLSPEIDSGISRAGGLLVSLLWLLLCVRRLHDTGRSAAGLLVALPAMASWAYETSGRLFHGWSALRGPWWLDAMAAASSIALLIMLFWTPQEGPNRYGPNPRDDTFPGLSSRRAPPPPPAA